MEVPNTNNFVFDIKAIAFDIDGTLYPTWKLYPHMSAHFFKHSIFYLHYGLVRNELHRMDVLPDLYHKQAELMAKRVKKPLVETRDKLWKVVYEGIEHCFRKIKPYDDIQETFKLFHEAGLKIGILSDFPPAQKGDIWGCLQYADVVLSSEETGALKPASRPFEVLSEKLGEPFEKILYVGNSLKYDIKGANSIGMKTAYILPYWKRTLHLTEKSADISFGNYRELQKIVLCS